MPPPIYPEAAARRARIARGLHVRTPDRAVADPDLRTDTEVGAAS